MNTRIHKETIQELLDKNNMVPKRGFITTFDESKWPFFILRVCGHVNNIEEFQNFTRIWSSIYVRSSKEDKHFRLIFDVRKVKKVDIRYLISITKFLKEVKELTATWMNRTAVYVSSQRVRKMIYFVTKFYKPVRPFRVFLQNETDEMIKWILSDENGEEVESMENVDEKDLIHYTDDLNVIDI